MIVTQFQITSSCAVHIIVSKQLRNEAKIGVSCCIQGTGVAYFITDHIGLKEIFTLYLLP